MSRLASISECIVCGDRNFGNFTYCSDKCESDDYPRIEMEENVEELKKAVVKMCNSITSIESDMKTLSSKINMLTNTLDEIIKNKSL